MKLSIILPFYHKVEEFKIALEFNKKYLTEDMELVIPVDEPDSGEAVVDILNAADLPCTWVVRCNMVPHGWRNPSKAINVGIRAASGEYILVMSPESILANDVYSILMNAANKNTLAIGRVVFHKGNVIVPAQSFVDSYRKDLFYGSICGLRSVFEEVKGYNENYTDWGRDDDDIRIRFREKGYEVRRIADAKVLHYEKTETRPAKKKDPNLHVPFTNADDWGQDF